MSIFILDPITDKRWDELVSTHPASSAFHSSGWLKALSKTYAYKPFVLTTTAPGQKLEDGVVFCEVDSWITGRRIVSLPFADHTEPLLRPNSDLREYIQWLRESASRERWKYIEMRPLAGEAFLKSGFSAGQDFLIHSLDLRPSLDELFRNLHKGSLQRRIRKAERGQLTYERGRSRKLLEEFFKLQILTRRRHRLLPQPFAWFLNLANEMLGQMDFRIVRREGVAIGAIVSLYHGKVAMYKYGCSNEAFHTFAPMPFLLWNLIKEAKEEGFETLDFGRSDKENEGLVRFKDQFGTTRRSVLYFRYPQSAKESNNVSPYLSFTGHIFSALPDSLSTGLGSVLYKHLG